MKLSNLHKPKASSSLETLVQQLSERLEGQEERLQTQAEEIIRLRTANSSQVQASREQHNLSTSRRRMLKKLAIGAAGVAAATTALAVTSQDASANYLGTSSGAGAAEYGLAASPQSIIAQIPPAGGTQKVGLAGTSDLAAPAFPNSQSAPAIGVYGSSNGCGVYGNGHSRGVVGVTTSGIGVLGSSDSGNGLYGLSNSGAGLFANSVSGSAVIAISDTGTALSGNSAKALGVFGQGKTYGGMFVGDRANLYLIPSATTGAPTTGGHSKGELFVDNLGTLYYCTTDGTPGSWVNLSGSASGGSSSGTITYLANPIRILGPFNTINNKFPLLQSGVASSFRIDGTWTNTNDGNTVTATIPANATGLVGTITAFASTSLGFVTVYPANVANVPVVASLVFGAGQFANTTIISKLGAIAGGGIGLNLYSNVNCTIALDAVGYTL